MDNFIVFIKKNFVLFVFVSIAIALTIVLMLSGIFGKELKLTKTNPEQGVVYSGTPYGSIFLYFSEEIDPKTIKISIVPQQEIIYEAQKTNGEFFLKIYPKTYWEMNQNYALTVEKFLTSVRGSRLAKDIVFNFSYLSPPGSEQQGIQGENGVDFGGFSK